MNAAKLGKWSMSGNGENWSGAISSSLRMRWYPYNGGWRTGPGMGPALGGVCRPRLLGYHHPLRGRRALAAERILSLEGVYATINQQFPSLAESFKSSTVERALKAGFRRLFYYHRLALAESLLEQRPEGIRLLMYTEWRRRYEDPSSGLDRLLEPTTASLQRLSPERDLERLIKSLTEIASWLESTTHLP